MKWFDLVLIALGLSMDAFAISICLGLSLPKASLKKSVIAGLYFGIFQAAMPLIGFALATKFANKIEAFDHWIAFILLAFIGGRMIVGSLREKTCRDRKCPPEICKDRECPKLLPEADVSLRPSKMLPLALATSIDAMAVGVSFAFLNTHIIPTVSIIGAITFLLSMLGVKLGRAFGTKLKSKAEVSGGIILVLMGIKILLEHLLVLRGVQILLGFLEAIPF